MTNCLKLVPGEFADGIRPDIEVDGQPYIVIN